MTTFNIALLLVAVSIGILIAAIVYNSKSKETLREAKDITAKAKSAVEEMERQRDASLDNYRKADMSLTKAKSDLSFAEGEKEALKENIHALADEIVNPAIPPMFGIEENEEYVRVVAGYTSLNCGKEIDLIVREFAKADDPSFALREAEYLLQTLNEK